MILIHLVPKNKQDKQDFNIFNALNKMHRHIKKLTNKSSEESSKQSLTDKISKRLLKLEFKKYHSIKSKCLNICCPHYKKTKLIL